MDIDTSSTLLARARVIWQAWIDEGLLCTSAESWQINWEQALLEAEGRPAWDIQAEKDHPDILEEEERSCYFCHEAIPDSTPTDCCSACFEVHG